jgi:peptidyl-prolyl cis-trans isomerase C
MHRLTVLILAALAGGSALAQNAPTGGDKPAAKPAAAATASDKSAVVATVNDKVITKSTVDQFVQQIGQPDSPELRDKIKEQLIEREVFLQEATKRGIPDRPDVKFTADFMRKTAIIQGLFRDEAKKHPITDEQIQAEYNKQKAVQGDKEYHARHILVEKEDEAKEIIAELKKGAKFEDLAKKSKDPGSGSRGGDLGWAGPGAYVKGFSDAMTKLEKGKYTETPVQTQFGYHVILLEDVRETQFPAFEQVKGQITESIQNRQAQAFAEELKKKAKIQ